MQFSVCKLQNSFRKIDDPSDYNENCSSKSALLVNQKENLAIS